jgi:6-phosphogluconolactonase (cycloisomerase 2 family)
VDGIIRVWEVNSGREVTRMIIEEPVNHSYSNNVLSVNFSSDVRYIVSGSYDNTVRVWEIATQREIMQMKQEDKIARLTAGGEIYVSPKVNSVAFSPDGKYIVSGSESKTVYLWNVATGQEIQHMEREDFPYSNDAQGKIPSVAFNPDGKYIISASDDNTISIWDVATGKEFSRIQNIYGYDKQVTFAAISPDGKYVVSGDSRGDVNLWLWRPADLIADACSRLPRNLTRVEWTKYIGDVLPYQAVCPNLQ